MNPLLAVDAAEISIGRVFLVVGSLSLVSVSLWCSKLCMRGLCYMARTFSLLSAGRSNVSQHVDVLCPALTLRMTSLFDFDSVVSEILSPLFADLISCVSCYLAYLAILRPCLSIA